MPVVERTAIVPYTCEEMFKLVNGFDQYPEFLPWCSLGKLHEISDKGLVASLGIKKGIISDQFTTQNTNFPPRTITMELLEGPFEFLQGSWAFDPLGNQALGEEKGCKIHLYMHFSFKIGLVNLLTKTLENDMAKMVDAFIDRAEDVYGKRVL